MYHIFFMRTTTRIFLWKLIFLRQEIRSSSTNPTDLRIIPSTLLRISALAFLPPLFLLLPPLRCPCAGFRTIHRRIVGCGREARCDYDPGDHNASVPPFCVPARLCLQKNGMEEGVLALALGAGVRVVARSPTSRKRGALGGLSILSC